MYLLRWLFASAVLIIPIFGVSLKDYCSYDKQNTPCSTECARSSKCGSGSTFSLLTDDERLFILDYHNKLRDEVAGGNYPKVPKASNMAALSYDLETEFLASCHVKACVAKHDKKRLTADGEKLGQNIAMAGSTSKKDMDNDFYKKGIQDWFDEYKLVNKEGIYSSYESGGGWGHFTQVIWAKTKYVGCGKIYFKDGKWHKFHLICNYKPAGNMIGGAVYVAGDPACPEKNSKYPNLCGKIRSLSDDDFVPPINLNRATFLFPYNLQWIALLVLILMS